MACAAIHTEPRMYVVGVRRRRVLRLVARYAPGGSAGVATGFISFVTLLANGLLVHSHERESRLLMLLKHILDNPGVHVVASPAVGSKLSLVNVVVAGRAHGRLDRNGERKAGVTITARNQAMFSFERKSGRIVFELRVLSHRPGAR
jgi:hypothetical protein